MPVIQTAGAVRAFSAPMITASSWGAPATDVGLYGHARSYAELYATQPNVRTCVDFLSRNVAQIGVHAFRRVSDTDRVRLADHEVIRWLTRPNPATTRYRLIESLMGDLGIYFTAYWLKLRTSEGDLAGLVRLPPYETYAVGGLLPQAYVWDRDGVRREFAPEDICYFGGYDPVNPLGGLSPLETLRRILAEEVAAADHREQYWRNAGRFEGVIEQSKESPNYTDEQKAAFRASLQQYAGSGPKAGMAALLPKGMTIKPWSFNARDSEYVASRKLSREECAAAYHIPLPMVGILDHATYSNIVEQHKQLYQDSLGPWLEMIAEELEAQLLPEARDTANVYLEFNIADKLKGSFEEQAASLQALVGCPIMTPNEGRARLNLPALTDPRANRLAPQQGGPSDATAGSGAPPAPPSLRDSPAPRTPSMRSGADAHLGALLDTTRTRQLARLARYPQHERSTAFFAEIDRYTRELATDLTPLVGAEAMTLAIQHNADLFTELDR
jgi:HK97 family phage portal protein